MRRYLAAALATIGFVIIAGASYLGVTRLMGSISSFASPFRASSLPPAAALGPRQTRRLVFVLVDALRYDTAADAKVMPTLNSLRARAATAEMVSIPPTYSQPSWTTLLTGAYPEISGAEILNADYDQLGAIPAETLFTVAHRSGLRTAVSGFNWFEKMVAAPQRDQSFFTPLEDRHADDAVVEAALPWLRTGEDALVLIHLDQVDYAGHNEGGPRDPRWNEAATRADTLLARILETVDLSQDTLLVVSDHGQIDRGGHGGQEAVVRREPFVLVGAGVVPGDYGRIEMTDVAPTLATLLGLPLPSASQGHVLPVLTVAPTSVEPLVAQQTTLGRAYLAAIGAASLASFQADPKDPVGGTQHAIAEARGARLASEGLPRAVIAVAVLALVLGLALRFGAQLKPVIIPALLALAAFHVVYALLEGRTYSLSSVASQGDILATAAIDTALGYLLGAALLTWLAWRQGLRGLRLTERLYIYTALEIALVGLGVLYGYWQFGLRATWALPDFLSAFLAFLSLLEWLALGALGVILPPLIGAGSFVLDRSLSRRDAAR